MLRIPKYIRFKGATYKLADMPTVDQQTDLLKKDPTIQSRPSRVLQIRVTYQETYAAQSYVPDHDYDELDFYPGPTRNRAYLYYGTGFSIQIDPWPNYDGFDVDVEYSDIHAKGAAKHTLAYYAPKKAIFTHKWKGSSDYSSENWQRGL